MATDTTTVLRKRACDRCRERKIKARTSILRVTLGQPSGKFLINDRFETVRLDRPMLILSNVLSKMLVRHTGT
ncbi:unnamed protein product [Clonostachys chloroleuca]|uniref:Uncharacterized protein n=1 Tax=Clonostachys chloroleuca TaxID=1926264 RepID=A0AA35M8A7_9HYPO|nr:unnamed protein product [Clonostachys chloroleuca]